MTVQIIGHRGSGRTENNPFAAGQPLQHTLRSFQKALESGADGVEFDIFISRDSVPVIIHRQGADDLNISRLTIDEIGKIALPGNEHILTLEEGLIFLAKMNDRFVGKNLIINAELKGPGVVEKTIEVIDRVAAHHSLRPDRIYFDALEWDRLSRMRDLDPRANIMPALSTARLFNLASRRPSPADTYDPAVFEELGDFIHDKRCCGIDVMTADIRPEMLQLADRMKVGFCSYPQGPHPLSAASSIQQNVTMLDSFSRNSQKPVILKVEDILAARTIVADCINKRATSHENIERIMGMRLT